MKKIKTTGGEFALVDDEDFKKANYYDWFAPNKASHLRAVVDGKIIYLHHLIIGKPEKGKVIDHKNGNPLDNRKENIRFCTQSQNIQNSKISKKNTSGYKGVSILNGKWRAQIKANGINIHLGSYENKMEAAYVYNEAAQKYFGEFAKINNI